MDQRTIQFNNTELIRQYVRRGKLLNPEKERVRAIAKFGFKDYMKELTKAMDCSMSAVSQAFGGKKPARLAVIHDLLNSLENTDINIQKSGSKSLGNSVNLSQKTLKS